MERGAVGASDPFRHQQLQDLVYKATCIKKCNYLGMIRYNNLASFFSIGIVVYPYTSLVSRIHSIIHSQQN